MSEAPPSLPTKPAAHPRQANIVRHAAWREARARIIAAAGAGPTTLALLGAAGTGKTWLLRELASDLRERGHEVTLLRQGDLPCKLTEGAALLVDEAGRMDEQGLAELAAQRSGLVVLADLPGFAETLERLPLPPATISLPGLDPEQLRCFVAEWVEHANERGVTVTDDAVQRLAVHSNGTPRLIAQLLNAALALAGLSGQGRIDGADIDQFAELRLGGLGSEPLEGAEFAASLREAAQAAVPPQADPAPERAEAEPAASGAPGIVPRRAKPVRMRRAALALSALAASILLGWLLEAPRQPVAVETAVVPSPSVAGSTAALALTDTTADIPSASLPDSPEQALVPTAPMAPAPPRTMATAAAIALADTAGLPPRPPVPSVPLATAPPPVLDAARAAPVMQPTPSPSVAIRSEAPVLMALARPPSPVPWAEPDAAREDVPSPDEAASRPVTRADSNAAPAYRSARGGPGLILIAHRGDTLGGLYANIYQGLRPPPYEDVVAANPRPFRPGTMVVFPAPPDGWTRPRVTPPIATSGRG